MNNKTQTVKGFRDFLPSEKKRRDFVAKKVIETFELFGFEPLETPTLEYANLLLGKYGKEADKLVYTFKDRGDRELALRYDQTVPTARVLAQYQQILPKYFRRYQIQNVFRADKPQKGRFREFTQCDIDIFGSNSPIADAEILAASYFAFKNVGFSEIELYINDRSILFNSLKPFVNDKADIFSLIQTVDKLDKIGRSAVATELSEKKGMDYDTADKLIMSISTALKSKKLSEIIELTKNLGVPDLAIKFKPYLARGLDYYTGMIFEVMIPGYGAGSCAGGGRYDKLIEQLGGINIPAVGVAFGFDRMVEAAEFLKLFQKNEVKTKVLMSIFDLSTRTKSLEIAKFLRENKITVEVFPTEDKLDKQLKYADKKGIPYVIIIGPDEIKKSVVKLKNMKTGDQQELTQTKLLEKLVTL